MKRFLKTYLFYYPVLRPAYYILGIYRIYIQHPATFEFRGKAYPYFHHWHGMTYLIERIVEVPIVWEWVRAHQGDRILEVGNCLSYFYPRGHDVLDKYDNADGVMHLDVVDYRPDQLYDLIASISTIEHVGWDETPKEPEKTLAAIENLTRCLAPNGEMVVTWALGYNPDIDRLFRERRIRFTETFFMQRVSGFTNRWRQVAWEDVKSARYGHPFRSGNAIVIGVLKVDSDSHPIYAEDADSEAQLGQLN